MQFDVYENKGDVGGRVPYLLDVQANLLSALNTRVVAPLVRAQSFGRPASRLHPILDVGGDQLILATHLLAAVQRADLGVSVASLAAERDRVISAVDVLLAGV